MSATWGKTDMAEIDRDDVIASMARGENATVIAKRLGVHFRKVQAVMREAIAEMADAETLRAEWFLEDHRLKTLGLRFYEIALKENDHQAAIVFLKASERRATPGRSERAAILCRSRDALSIDRSEKDFHRRNRGGARRVSQRQ